MLEIIFVVIVLKVGEIVWIKLFNLLIDLNLS